MVFHQIQSLLSFAFFGIIYVASVIIEKLINTLGQGRRSGMQGMDGQQQKGIIRKRETQCTRDSKGVKSVHRGKAES